MSELSRIHVGRDPVPPDNELVVDGRDAFTDTVMAPRQHFHDMRLSWEDDSMLTETTESGAIISKQGVTHADIEARVTAVLDDAKSRFLIPDDASFSGFDFLARDEAGNGFFIQSHADAVTWIELKGSAAGGPTVSAKAKRLKGVEFQIPPQNPTALIRLYARKKGVRMPLTNGSGSEIARGQAKRLDDHIRLLNRQNENYGTRTFSMRERRIGRVMLGTGIEELRRTS